MTSDKLPPHIRIDVTASLGGDDALKEGLRTTVKESLTAHIRSRLSRIQELSLHVVITEAVENPVIAVCELTLDGQVNGNSIARKARAVRNASSVQLAGGAVGFGLGALISLAISWLTFKAFGAGKRADSLMHCYDECIAELSLAVDEAISWEESASSQYWKKISRWRWIAAVVATVLFALPFARRKGLLGFLAGLIFSAFLAPTLFWLVHVTALMFMPYEFFIVDPRGQRALAKSGVNSVIALRVLCAVLSLVLTLFAVCWALLLVLMAFEEPRAPN